MRRVSIKVVAFGVLMLLAGAGLGVWATSRLFRAQASIASMGFLQTMSQISIAQYDNADDDTLSSARHLGGRLAGWQLTGR
ncbi:MAG TPA: hypothetical protein VJM31_11355 [Vicinamibacterales bacterium]|nr:hypothetical protein [Vicinamibacterales bacterium]